MEKKDNKTEERSRCVYCGEDLSNSFTAWRICSSCLVKESPRRKR